MGSRKVVNASVVELVDTRDLKSLGLFRAGSNPAGGTNYLIYQLFVDLAGLGDNTLPLFAPCLTT